MVKIRRARLMSPTGKAVVVTPVWPNAGVQAWYEAQLDKLIGEMYLSACNELVPVLRDVTPIIVARDVETVAAGIIFQCGPRILLLHRTDGTGWAFPGGGIEPGESSEEAARRETREETGLRFTQPLTFSHVQEFNGIGFATYLANVPDEFVPTLNDEHDDYLWIAPELIRSIQLHPGVFSTLFCGGVSVTAMDAGPTKALQLALEKWSKQWIQRFDKMSLRISLDFAARNQRATETAMHGALRKAGFVVPFKPTRASVEAYKAVAAEQVGLIKSIPQKFHTDVQTQVWESVRRGSDLKTLSTKLAKTYNVTRKRAALIARDQNAKAKATMEAVWHQELGIRQGIWMHSHAGKEPRPTHVAMNGKLYDLDKGMWDSDEQKFVHPGELINCRCTMRPYIPGFEDASPAWGIVET